jgi:hypothetical protein
MTDNNEVVLQPVVLGGNPEDWYRYEPEKLDRDEDDGRMPENLEELSKNVIGRKIVSAEKAIMPVTSYGYTRKTSGFLITLDDGKRVFMGHTDDCCAFTNVHDFLLHPDKIDHAITGVGTTDGFTKWHIYADYGDILELDVAWSCGNPFYYGYGFDIEVMEVPEQPAIEMPFYKATSSQE